MPALLTRISSFPNAFFVSEKKPLDIRLFGEVRLNGDGLAAHANNLADDAVRSCLARGVVDDYGSAFVCQVQRDRSSDPFGRSGDDCYFSSQFLRHDALLERLSLN